MTASTPNLVYIEPLGSDFQGEDLKAKRRFGFVTREPGEEGRKKEGRGILWSPRQVET